MVAQSREQVKPDLTGYRPGTLERMVRMWAKDYWPDSKEESNWRKYQAYYWKEYLRQMRWETLQGRRG